MDKKLKACPWCDVDFIITRYNDGSGYIAHPESDGMAKYEISSCPIDGNLEIWPDDLDALIVELNARVGDSRIKELEDNNGLLNAALAEAKRFMQQQEDELIACHGDGWVSVEDRLPKEKGRYMVTKVVGSMSPKTRVEPERFTTGEYPGFFEGAWTKVTHWMPLPSPPQKGKK